jgi:diadenosine tetraphosphate (Ap4A) HIT family hydrolase
MSDPRLATCPFCALLDHQTIERNALAMAVRDGFPVARGHSLIVPRRHVSSFFELTVDERLAILELLDRAKIQLDGQYAPAGYNIGINDGVAAGQTVMHLHVHLIPRYKGDVADPRGGVRWIFPEKAAYWKQ